MGRWAEAELKIPATEPTSASQGVGRVNWKAWVVALAGLLLVLSWQWLVVQGAYGGNWTGLFRIGSKQPRPPGAQFEGDYLIEGSTGYDGQFYRLVAHDPLNRHGLADYVDSPGFRYSRILLPLLAHLIALGNPNWIDQAYIGVIVACSFFGTLYSARLARTLGLCEWYGLFFLLLPATWISINRLTVDVAVAAGCAAYLVWSTEQENDRTGFKMWALLAALPFVRETGVLIAGAHGLKMFFQRRWKALAGTGLVLLPWLAWSYHVMASYPAGQHDNWVASKALPGLLTFWQINHFHWDLTEEFLFAVPILLILDYACVVLIWLGIGLTSYWMLKRQWTSATLVAAGYAALAFYIRSRVFWLAPYSYTRVFTPFYLAVGYELLKRRRFLLASFFVLPPVIRALLPHGPELLAVLRWIGASV